MAEIQIAVINKIPSVIGDVKCIVADNSDYFVRFSFDDQWAAGTKTVYFVLDNGFAYPPVIMESDIVEIPRQTRGGVNRRLYIGVEQGGIRTSRGIGLSVYSSITDMIDDEAVQPGPSLWEDIVSRLETLEESGVPTDKIEEAVGDYLAKNPIESVKPGNALEMIGDTLNVITTDEAEQDNTLPITSAGVHTIVGNISAILDTI